MYESAHSLSRQDSSGLFSDALMAENAKEQGEEAEVSSSIEGLQEQRSERNPLGILLWRAAVTSSWISGNYSPFFCRPVDCTKASSFFHLVCVGL